MVLVVGPSDPGTVMTVGSISTLNVGWKVAPGSIPEVTLTLDIGSLSVTMLVGVMVTVMVDSCGYPTCRVVVYMLTVMVVVDPRSLFGSTSTQVEGHDAVLLW